MARPFEDLRSELARCSRLVRKQRKLLSEGRVTESDVDFIYEIAFLSAYVSFEVFIERQFQALLVGKPYFKNKAVKSRISVRSEIVAREVIRGVNQFPKFLPGDALLKLSDIFFSPGHPFSRLDGSKKQVIDRAQIIRNVIAHRSASAITKFQKTILSQSGLRPPQRNPAAYYLRSAVSQSVDRFDQIVGDLALIGREFAE